MLGSGFYNRIKQECVFFDEKRQMKKASKAHNNRLVGHDNCEGVEAYAGQRVRCAVSCVELEGKKAVRVTSISYSTIPFNSAGQVDQEEINRGLYLAMSGFDTFSHLI
jgi:hypothetical protein